MLIIHRFLFALFSIHNAVLIFFYVVSLSSTFSTLYFCFFFPFYPLIIFSAVLFVDTDAIEALFFFLF